MEPDFSHFRFYVCTRLRLGIAAKDIYDELCSAWQEQAPSYSAVKKWKVEFSRGERTSFEDAPRSGRPQSSRTADKVREVEEAIKDDPKLSTRDLALFLNIGNATVHEILTEDLSMRNVCSVWIPHHLSAMNMDLRVGSAKHIRKCLASLKMMKYDHYAVMDETWVNFDPQFTKAENRVWIGKDEPRPQVARPALTNRKTMLMVAFTANGRFSVRATAPGETVNSELFVDFMKTTGNKWRTLRKSPITLKELHWQMDNARPHTSAQTKAFFEDRGVSLVWQSPYSPDYNICDRFLFNTLKAGLRRETFETHLEVEEAALRLLREISEEVLHRQVDELYEHLQDVINAGGQYVTD